MITRVHPTCRVKPPWAWSGWVQLLASFIPITSCVKARAQRCESAAIPQGVRPNMLCKRMPRTLQFVLKSTSDNKGVILALIPFLQAFGWSVWERPMPYMMLSYLASNMPSSVLHSK